MKFIPKFFKNVSLNVTLALAMISFAPLAFADGAKTPKTINDIFIGFATGNLGGLIPTVVLVGLITFLAGVLKFVRAGDNEEKRASGRQVIIYGIIILFVMMAYWGFVRILTQSFFGADPKLPDYLPPLQTN
jgi:hypothetical protein